MLLTIISILGFSTTVNAATLGVKWNSVPITIYATNQLSNNEILNLQSAIAEWNSIGKGTLIKYGGIKSGISNPRVDGINTVGKFSMPSNDVARTNSQILNNVTIIESDITLNTNKISGKNLKSIFMHELGHALGLADNTYSISSIMYASYTGNTTISQYDINDINSLY